MTIRTVRSIHLMWSQACDQVDRADRLHRQFYRLGRVGQIPAWEPPVDVFETGSELLIRAAIPDVDPADFEISLRDGGVLLAGRRRLPAEATRGVIRQLEILTAAWNATFRYRPGDIALPPIDMRTAASKFGCKRTVPNE